MDRTNKVWVSPEGSSSGSGSEDDPLDHPSTALAWLRERRQRGDLRKLEVVVEGGTYRVPEPLALTSLECPEGSETLITGRRNSRPILLGSLPCIPRLADTQRFAARHSDKRIAPSLLAFDLPDSGCTSLDLGTLGFRLPVPATPPLISVAGKRSPWACWPTDRKLRGSVVSVSQRAGSESDLVTIQVTEPALTLPVQDLPLWVEMAVRDPWVWLRCRVRECNDSAMGFTAAIPSGIAKKGDSVSDIRFINALAGIAPGQSVLDPSSRAVLVATAVEQALSENKLDVEASVNEAAFWHLKDAHNVQIANMEFKGSNGSGIVAENCPDFTVNNCTFTNIGREAIFASGYGIKVWDCHLSDIGMTGIRLESGNTNDLHSSRSRIIGTKVSAWAFWKLSFEPAIRARGVGIRITGCTIENGPCFGIDLTGNDHVVEGCAIGDIHGELEDTGSIYINQGETPLRRGMKITGNFFFNLGNQRPLTPAIYLDRATCGTSVENNLFVAVDQDGLTGSAVVQANGPSDTSIKGNCFVACGNPILIDFYLADWGIRDLGLMKSGREAAIRLIESKPFPHLEHYPSLEALLHEDLVFPRSNRVEENLFVRCNQSSLRQQNPITVRYAERSLLNEKESSSLADLFGPIFETHLISKLIRPRDVDEFLENIAETKFDWWRRARESKLTEECPDYWSAKS
jgi:hypothetical protein